MKIFLQLLEDFIKSNAHYSEHACQLFLEKLIESSSLSRADFYQLFISHFSRKQIVFIRHAESIINVWVQKNPIKFMLSLYPSDPSLYNPGLTPHGQVQCKQLQDNLSKLASTSASHDKEQKHGHFDLAVVSPYHRTISTFDRVKISETLSGASVVVNPLIRERAAIPASVVGFKRSQLLIHRRDLDCHLLTKEKWWKPQLEENTDENQKESIMRENDRLLETRVLIFLLWATFREERRIVFFSHCAVYEAIKLFRTHKPENAVPHVITTLDAEHLFDKVLKNKSSL